MYVNQRVSYVITFNRTCIIRSRLWLNCCTLRRWQGGGVDMIVKGDPLIIIRVPYPVLSPTLNLWVLKGLSPMLYNSV